MRASGWQAALVRAVEFGEMGPLRRAIECLEARELAQMAASLSGVELWTFMRALRGAERRKVTRLLEPSALEQLRRVAWEHHQVNVSLLMTESSPESLGPSVIPGAGLPLAQVRSWRRELHGCDDVEDAAGLFVVDEECRPCGWLPLAAMLDEEPAVEPVEVALDARTPARAAWQLLRDGMWSALPVVDREGRYLGYVTGQGLARRILLAASQRSQARRTRQGVVAFLRQHRYAISFTISCMVASVFWVFLTR